MPPVGQQQHGSIGARDNLLRSIARRADIYGHRYPEEVEFYTRLGLPAPTPPTRHDRERIARLLQEGREGA